MVLVRVRRWLAAMCASVFLLSSFAIPAFADSDPSNPGAHQPIDLDLTSTTQNLSAPHFVQNNPVDILVGDAVRTVTSTSVLTPAERLAAYQVFSTGQQSIIIGQMGNAIGGTFTMGANFSNYVNSLVIPTGVTAVKDFGIGSTLNLAGNLTNAGNLYAMSSNSAVTTATIMAANIINQQNALMTSIYPAAGLPGFTNAASALNLNLIAINEIINHGTISSSGNLAMTAGGAITNLATITAAQNAALTSAIGAFNNSGLISAMSGNVNVASQMARTLAFNNVGGTLQALNGQINASTASATALGAKPTLTVTGGDLVARELNFTSTGGLVEVGSRTMEGRLNINAGEAHVTASTPNLVLGQMNLTGDPTYWNAGGDITLGALTGLNNSNLSVIAAGNIITGAGTGDIDVSSSTFNAGSILMIAGANITSPASGSGSDDTTTVITIGGASVSIASSTGGMIDLTGGGLYPITSLNASTTSTTGGDGGSVTLIAFAGSGTGAGTITLPTDISITTGTSTNNDVTINGNVTIIAGATSGNAIQVGGINTSGNVINPQVASNGQVVIASATPIFASNPGGTGTSVTATTGASFTDMTITVSDVSNLNGGQTIYLNPLGGNAETLTIDSINGNVLTFTTPLAYSHTVGDGVYVAAESLIVHPNGVVGSVVTGLPMTVNGGIILPGPQQSGNITAGSSTNPIVANNSININTNPSASTGNGVVNINGSMNLTMNVTTATAPLLAYQAYPTISITGTAVTVASGATVSSQIFSGPLSSPTTTYANAPNFINISTQALTNNGTITGGATGSTPFSNSYINISSPSSLTLTGTGNFTVPGYSVIELAVADGNTLNIGSAGNSLPTFNAGTGSVVIFNAQGSNGNVFLAANQTLTVTGGPIISINTPSLGLGSGSQLSATGTSIIAVGSGYTADDLNVSILGSGNAIISTASGGAIRFRPTDGQNLTFSSTLSGGTLTFTGAVARLATSGGGSTSGVSSTIPVSSSYVKVENPAGGILGGEFQPYVGGFFSSLNGSPPKFVSFSAYPFHVVLALLAPVAAEQQMQVLSTYTQAYSTSYVIGAAKQLGLRVSAGVFVDLAPNGTNVAPDRTTFDTKWALNAAQQYGNVIDIVVGNEDIVASGTGGDPADPSPSVNTLVAAIQSVQSQRASYTNPVTGLPFGASDMPVTTRQEIGVLTGDVTDYASMRTLLNTVDSHIYGNVYPFFNEEIVIPGLIPGMSQSAFQTLVQTNMSLQYGNATTAFLNAKTLPSGQTPVLNPPDLRVGETGWATELLSPAAAPGYGYAGSGLLQQNTQWAEWYYSAMQDWSFNYQNPITGNKGVIIAGYFGLYNEPWKGIDGGGPGGGSASLMTSVLAGATSIATCCFATFPTLTPQSIIINPNSATQEVQNILGISGSTLTISALINAHNSGEVIDAGHPEEPFFGIWVAGGVYPLDSGNANDPFNGYVFTLTGSTLKYSYSSPGLPVYPAGQPAPPAPPGPVIIVPSQPTVDVIPVALLGSLGAAINAGATSQQRGSTTIIAIDQTPGMTSTDDITSVNQTDREDLFLSALTLGAPTQNPSNAWQADNGNNFYSENFLSSIEPSNGQPGMSPIESHGTFDSCTLSRGAAFFTPDRTLQVQTQEGVVSVDNGSQAFVIETGHDVSVYNLHDSRHGGVKVVVGSKSIRVPLGKQLVLTRKPDATFDEINPGMTIANRNPQKLEFGDGVSGYMADFSIMSAVANIGPVKKMLTSKQPDAYKLGQQIIKNAAIMATISTAGGPYKTSK